MGTVGVRELKNGLTRYLRRTKHGEEIIVTERGKPIALLTPIKSAKQARSLEARLAALAAQGWLTLPTRKPLKRIRAVKIQGGLISRTVIEDRR